MAMDRKTFIAVLFSLGVLFSAVGVQLFPVANAFQTIITPTITLNSPCQACVYLTNNVTLDYNISLYTHTIIGGYLETIDPLYYQIDAQTPVSLSATYVPPYTQQDTPSMVYAIGNYSLPSLPDGVHNLTIFGTANQKPLTPADSFGGSYNENISKTVSFTIDATPPIISDLSIGNTSYSSTQIPLSFMVSKTTSWMGYSLDNRANITVNGNVTLTDLAEGYHNLVVYANDTFGNMGKSDAVFFNVTLPAPTPNPTSTPSATAVPSPSAPEFPTMVWPVILLATAFVLATAAIMVKRKH